LISYANGRFSFYEQFFSLTTLAWLIVTPFWRDTHFYFIHRVMHKWNTKRIPDIGKFLYKHVHSYHHKSRNIQPWSGISMHPVEGLMYMSACLVPCLFWHHPLLINIVKIELVISAVVGHDGHDFPGNGNWFHYLHHTKIDCNYGTPAAPLDYLFGTVYYGDESEVN
jgi:sterol desaturase/sphingolipid hydroxylase (fatty acid hydroxylase superfamily)